MKRAKFITSIMGMLLVMLVVMYQNCSDPIQNVGSGPGGEGPENCQNGGCGAGDINAFVSLTPDGGATTMIDAHRDYYLRFTGFTVAQDIYACAAIYRGTTFNCPEANFRHMHEDEGFEFISSGNARKREVACPLTGCTPAKFSHSPYFGTWFQVEVAKADFSQKEKRTFYIKPPHLSSNYTEAVIWYSEDEGGQTRLANWIQERPSVGGFITSYVDAGQAFYSHWMNLTTDHRVCIKSFTGDTPPSATTCASTDWYPPQQSYTVTDPANSAHQYNHNATGFPLGKYITFLKASTTGPVLDHLTTVIVVE